MHAVGHVIAYFKSIEHYTEVQSDAKTRNCIGIMVELLVDDLPYLVVGLVFLKEFVESLPVSHDRTRLDVLNNFLVEQN